MAGVLEAGFVAFEYLMLPPLSLSFMPGGKMNRGSARWEKQVKRGICIHDGARIKN